MTGDTAEEQAARRLVLAPMLPAHGTRTRYNAPHSCRCNGCRAAEARYQKRRTLRLEQTRRAS